MQIARELAGYSLGGADLLRRAMGKKDARIMAEQKSKFVAGAVLKDVPQRTAEEIFSLIEKFAEYGFNKSHSAAYALVSYQTAWLKAHHPAAYMCAVLTAEMADTDKLVKMIDECRQMALEILPPDINRSGYEFSVVDGRTIRYGLGAIKGVGHAAIEGVLADRASSGHFSDLYDFCRRIDSHKLNRRVLEALIQAGAIDGLGGNRATLLHNLPQALAHAGQHLQASAAGQVDLFGLDAGSGSDVAGHALTEVPEWPEAQRLQAEKNTLGLYLTGHPIRAFAAELKGIVSGSIADLVSDIPAVSENRGENGFGAAPGRNVTIAGLVVDKRRIRNGNRLILTLDDESGRADCVLFEDRAREYEPILQIDRLLIVQGRLSFDEYSDRYRINPQQVMDIDAARTRYAQRILLKADALAGKRLDAFEACLAQYRHNAGCPVTLRYHNGQARADLNLDDAWRVRVCEGLVGDLRRLLGQNSVHVIYRRPA
jgi:DNA polymerase-3 subunit alpha